MTRLPAGSLQAKGPGRPTKAQAEARHELLLDRAFEIFLEKGFEQATIDGIASTVHMTKRTVYARYEDKAALFRAAVQRSVDRWIVSIETMRAVETDDLEETLTAIARIRVKSAMSPSGVQIQRILDAEAYQFPDISRLYYEQGTLPAIAYIAEVLERHAEAGAIEVDQPELLGNAFLSLVVSGLARGAIWGTALDEEEIEESIRFGVRLFLDGVRPRETPASSTGQADFHAQFD
ncbi:TetR/AcrR family transcriptional regulator [Nocardia sp. 348MFTsu5.1]|uniref:TetR/AcrR family transcriptional regulator n=1 Tax=Nocardia sp. 348MFTsu5.1 TaxID=1172185 RepID=UPI00037C7918|nr:TetR/AcrR family transcriptional regulator [Nocardia sp. 348MFTsu5.1]